MDSPTQIYTINEALESLGVTSTTLTSEEKLALEEKGYVLLYDILNTVELKHLRNAYEHLMKKEGQSAGLELFSLLEKGTRKLADLVNKGSIFDTIYIHPKVLAAVYHVLKRDFKLSSLHGRDALPMQGYQQLHADWGVRNLDEPYHAANSIWMLDDFTPDNGAPRIVPGTHKLQGEPTDYLNASADTDPEQVLLVAPAGSVVVFNAHVWHGGTTNTTTKARRALLCFFTARELQQQLDQRKYIQKATFERISPAARYILDV